MPATEAHQKLILKRKKKIEKKLGGNVEFTGKFEAVTYKRTVAGHTDEIYIDVGEADWVKITVVQKASGSYLLWDAHWFTPDEEVEVGQLEIEEEKAAEENEIKGTPRVMERKKAEEDVVQEKKMKQVEQIPQAQVASSQSSQPPEMNSGNQGPNAVQPKKAKKPMQIVMGGSSPQPQIVQKPIQAGVAQAQHAQKPVQPMIQPAHAQQNYQPIQPAHAQQNYQPIQPAHAQQNYQPIKPAHAQQNFQPIQPMHAQQNYQPIQSSHPSGLLHVTVIDNAYEHRQQSSGQPANEKTYHPRQMAAPQAPQVLFVKTINPF